MEEKSIEEILKEVEENASTVFHPLYERSRNAWVPSNQAGIVASMISHAWEDIHCLSKIRAKTEDDYEKKLLLKYMVVELRSILEQMDTLQGIVFQIIKGGCEHHGYVSNEESQKITALFKKYHKIKSVVEKDLVAIRNKIGAHRSQHPWDEIMELWDKLDSEIFKDIFEFMPEIFAYLIKLDIYDWSRSVQENSVDIICSGLNRPYKAH